MRIIVFIDSENFRAFKRKIRKERNQDRIIDYYKINKFVINYLSKNWQYEKVNLQHIRTYYYTGEYTDQLIKRIENAISKTGKNQEKKLDDLLKETKKNREGQKKFFKQAEMCKFFELRKKPLQFTQKKGVFQKGVDVQLAVDLVAFAYKNAYDIAVIFSGDIDLLESLRTVKDLGKHIIIFSHYKHIAKEMKKLTDMFIDFQKMEDNLLDEFTHIFIPKPSQEINKKTPEKIIPTKKQKIT